LKDPMGSVPWSPAISSITEAIIART
jgi:hypothetical protein